MVEKDEVSEAAMLIMDNKLEKGEELLKNVIKSMPAKWQAMKETGGQIAYAFWDMQDFQSFVQFQSTAKNKKDVVWVHPSYSRAYYYLAYIRIERGETDAALAMLDKSLSLEPDNPHAMCEKAQVLANIGRIDEAIGLFQKASGCRPWSPPQMKARALRGVGFSYIEKGELDNAEEMFLKSLEFDPGNRHALNELGYIGQLRQRHPKGADPGGMGKTTPDVMILDRICPAEALMDDSVVDEIVVDATGHVANKKISKVFIRFTSDFMDIPKERRAEIAKRIRQAGAEIMIASESSGERRT